MTAHDDGTCPLCGAVRRNPDVTVGGVTLSGYQISKGGLSVTLGRVQFAIMRLLAERAGRPVSHDAVMAHVYGEREDPPDERIVSVHLHYLRRIVGWDAIETRWGGMTIFHPEKVILDPDKHPEPKGMRKPLSDDEVATIRTMVGQGISDQRIATQLGRSWVTVRKYRRQMRAA